MEEEIISYPVLCCALYNLFYCQTDDVQVFGYFVFVKYFNKMEENTKKTNVPERWYLVAEFTEESRITLWCCSSHAPVQ